MDIEHVGEKLIDQLVDHGLVIVIVTARRPPAASQPIWILDLQSTLLLALTGRENRIASTRCSRDPFDTHAVGNGCADEFDLNQISHRRAS